MRFWWDIVIILLATFNSFAIPFLIAFQVRLIRNLVSVD